MRLYILLLLSIVFLTSFSQTQRCSTDEYVESLKSKGLYNYNTQRTSINHSYTGNYNIPVVVHVLYNTDEQNISDARIYSQIETLNNDYNALNTELVEVPEEFQSVIGNVGFNFFLVQEDMNGSPCSGINRVYTEVDSFLGFSDDMKKSEDGGVDAWNTECFLNIWVCNLSGNTLGFATMPDIVTDDLDGVVIDYEFFGVDLSSSSPYNLGKTGTHEVGHYFDLEHPFSGGCSDWDGCDDTPSTSSPTYGCPSYPQLSCQTNNMSMNFMDYTDDACMSMFTTCQAQRMQDALLNYRPGLINSSDCAISLENYIKPPILVYPNPVKNLLCIENTNSYIIINDLYGRELLVNYMYDNNCLDVSGLAAGTYILSVDHNTLQFIKN